MQIAKTYVAKQARKRIDELCYQKSTKDFFSYRAIREFFAFSNFEVDYSQTSILCHPLGPRESGIVARVA